MFREQMWQTLPEPEVPKKKPLWRKRFLRGGRFCIEQKPAETDVNPWGRYITSTGTFVNPALYDVDDAIDEDTDMESYKRLRKMIGTAFRVFKRR